MCHFYCCCAFRSCLHVNFQHPKLTRVRPFVGACFSQPMLCSKKRKRHSRTLLYSCSTAGVQGDAPIERKAGGGEGAAPGGPGDRQPRPAPRARAGVPAAKGAILECICALELPPQLLLAGSVGWSILLLLVQKRKPGRVSSKSLGQSCGLYSVCVCDKTTWTLG